MTAAVGTVWRHKKRGTKYVIMGRSNVQISSDTLWKITPGINTAESTAKALEKLSWITYRSIDDDQITSRPESEFLDGRFEYVAACLI